MDVTSLLMFTTIVPMLRVDIRHYHAERGNENLSRTSIHLTSQNRRAARSTSRPVSKNATKHGTVALKNGTLARLGTRDTSCNHPSGEPENLFTDEYPWRPALSP
ncbi:hypothetical protein GS393_02386 [Pseudomonas savastanoi pv. phaseolicola]|nr:hypothetical protein [Pseudomonas savastanoi pv. phaseolicola]